MKCHHSNRNSLRTRAGGLTLVETVVAVGVGSLVLLVVTTLSIYAMRSFAAMGNYAILDARNRLAVDKMTRDVREATLLYPPYSDSLRTSLTFTNPVEGGEFSYVWYPSERSLICYKGGQEQTYLIECDQWNFTLYERLPVPGAPNSFVPAMNWTDAKMVEFSWKCSRSFLGKKWNTESVQSVRIMLRNKN